MERITTEMVFTASNISSFRGYAINGAGEVELSDGEYQETLNEIYGDVQVCGMSYGAGDALEALDPVAFRCSKGDHESELTTEFQEALDNQDASDLEFSEHKPDDINEDDEDDEEDE